VEICNLSEEHEDMEDVDLVSFLTKSVCTQGWTWHLGVNGGANEGELL
jgi:hypothetical protein